MPNLTRFGRPILCVVVAMIFLPLFFSTTAHPAAAWTDSNWTRRRPITITTGNNGMPENYQIRITVPYDADMQADYEDLRFYLTDDVTELSFWIENYTGAVEGTDNAYVWVRLPFSLAASANQDINMYYGNASAGSAENGGAVFIVFDDFEDALQGDWTTVAGSPDYTNTETAYSGSQSMKLSAAGGYDRVTIPVVHSASIAIKYKLYKDDDGEPDLRHIDDGNTHCTLVIVQNNEDIQYYDGNYHTIGTMPINSWQSFELRDWDWTSHTYDILYDDVVLQNDAGMQAYGGYPDDTVQMTVEAGIGWLDDFIVRAFVSPEPTASVGGEETTASWHLIETWTGTVSAPAQWNHIETWTGTINAPAQWNLIETWSATVNAPTIWNLIETWTGTIGAPAEWNLIETWSETIRAPAEWSLIESWTGTVNAPTQWNLIESWTATVNAPAEWNLIETWTGTVSAPAQWNLIETWTGTVSASIAPAQWRLIETWTGTVNAPASWNLIETWAGTVQTTGYVWNLIETWTAIVKAPAEWSLIETWSGTVNDHTQWNLIETWTGTVTASAQWSLIESWTGLVQAPAAWQLIENWIGTVEASVPPILAWQLIETWTGTVVTTNNPDSSDGIPPPGAPDWTPPPKQDDWVAPGQREDWTPPGKQEDWIPLGQRDDWVPPGKREDWVPPGKR